MSEHEVSSILQFNHETMTMTGKKTMQALGGVVLCSIAVIVIIVGLEAVIDPVGTQMADDVDPFGKPHARLSFALICLAGIGIFMVGRWLIRTGNRTQSEVGPHR